MVVPCGCMLIVQLRVELKEEEEEELTTKTQFQVLCSEKSFEWICPKSAADECFNCEKIFRLDKEKKNNLFYLFS